MAQSDTSDFKQDCCGFDHRSGELCVFKLFSFPCSGIKSNTKCENGAGNVYTRFLFFLLTEITHNTKNILYNKH